MSRSRDISAGTTRDIYTYTATSGQTTFSGADDSSSTLSYTAGKINVYLNGTRLSAADYTATNGTSVVLAAGVSAGDTLDIEVFGIFSIANVGEGGGAIYVNNESITTSYTIASGQNGFSVGPVTIESGVTITISDGQRWVIL